MLSLLLGHGGPLLGRIGSLALLGQLDPEDVHFARLASTGAATTSASGGDGAFRVNPAASKSSIGISHFPLASWRAPANAWSARRRRMVRALTPAASAASVTDSSGRSAISGHP